MKLNRIFLSTLYFILFIGIQSSAFSLTTHDSRIQGALSKLEKMPEFNQLVQNVEKDGPVKIEMETMNSESFDAYWSSSERIIRINAPKNRNDGVLLCSILFELHNASSDNRFKSLYQMAERGQIHKEDYVKKVEEMEHKNALGTSTLLDKGIRLGYFPADAHWSILRSFDDHYMLQQLHGHSAWIANNFDRLFPQYQYETYKGTIPNLIQLSDADKQDLIYYLALKNQLESPIQDQARLGAEKLQKEYAKLEGCLTGKTTQGCTRSSERLRLLDTVFNTNVVYQSLIKNSHIHEIAEHKSLKK